MNAARSYGTCKYILALLIRVQTNRNHVILFYSTEQADLTCIYSKVRVFMTSLYGGILSFSDFHSSAADIQLAMVPK